MKVSAVPDESARLAALYRYDILDTLPESDYDDIVQLATHICGVPIAAINFIDRDRQWSKASQGLADAELPREVSLCAHAITTPQRLTVVEQLNHDPRFADNLLVTGPAQLAFYAGAPLVTEAGEALGTLCVADRVSHTLTSAQQHALTTLARQVMVHLELRRAVTRLEIQQQELERANALLTVQSTKDGLTGLNNRRALTVQLAAEIERSRRYNYPLSLLIMDVDHFKTYNDAFGHLAGDEMLKQLASLLLDEARTSDFIARYGGEEFVILLPNTTNAAANQVAERFRQVIETTTWPEQAVTVSIGLATLNAAVASGDELLEAADQMLYIAKRRGRNRVVATAVS